MGVRMKSVVFQENPGGSTMVYVLREIDDETGTPYIDSYSFPAEVFEIRAAEYDIDPEDFDTLLDIVQYEVWLPPADTSLLWDADDVPKARDGYLAAVRREKAKHEGRKTQGAKSARVKADEDAAHEAAKQTIRSRRPRDPELRALIAEHRDMERERVRARRRERQEGPQGTEILKRQLRARTKSRKIRERGVRGRPQSNDPTDPTTPGEGA